MESLKPLLGIHELIPPITLPSTQGGEVKLWNYKMRKNLVVLFYHGAECCLCKKKLKILVENYQELVKLEAEVLAVSSDGLGRGQELSAQLGVPYPLLSDPEGKVIEKYTYWREEKKAPLPSVFVTDRFGTLYYQFIADEATELPGLEEILSWLEFIQSQCPECSI